MFVRGSTFPFRLTLLILLLMTSAGCVTPQAPHQPQESAFFVTLESGFHIATREATIRYAVTLRVLPSLNEPLFLNLHYENPAAPSQPHLEETTVEPNIDLLHLESPPLSGLESGRTYRIEIQVFDDVERTHLVDTHEILILSAIDMKSHER